MTVFKTFWKVIKKYKGTIILYTALLVIFGAFNMSTSDNSMNFVDSKPDVLIINNDEKIGLTSNFIEYIENNSNIIEVKENDEAVNDALFYRDVNFIIYIPENYRENVLDKKNPEIEFKSTGDYNASLAQMMITRYLELQNIYLENTNSEEELINSINDNLSKKTKVEMTSSLDTSMTSNMAFYFNFASYSILAVVIFVICLVLSSFHEKAVKKRIVISSMNYRKHNRCLLFASFIYAVIVWGLFIILGIIMVGDLMLSIRGMIYMLNAFVFTFCAISIALLISNLVTDKNAVSSIVNVVALRVSIFMWGFCSSRIFTRCSFENSTCFAIILVY